MRLSEPLWYRSASSAICSQLRQGQWAEGSQSVRGLISMSAILTQHIRHIQRKRGAHVGMASHARRCRSIV